MYLYGLNIIQDICDSSVQEISRFKITLKVLYSICGTVSLLKRNNDLFQCFVY